MSKENKEWLDNKINTDGVMITAVEDLLEVVDELLKNPESSAVRAKAKSVYDCNLMLVKELGNECQ